ncbi:MAG TPA: mechanosensitive ion channel domain-containing protein [Gemmatimonadales bacterium]|nr:mechanosensitive ion channel domain-containing protein [Gemmatimonadales bacterium]
MPLLLSLQDIITELNEQLRLDGGELIRRLVQVVAIWTLAWIGLWIIRIAARRIEKAVDDGDPRITTIREKRGLTIAQLLRTVGRGLVLVLGLLLTLNLFIEIGPLLAGAGILGLAVSFGAQSLVKDFLSGFFFLLENQFAIGDVIEAGGKVGVVEQITLRIVVLRDVEGVRHIIPNGEIKAVSNRTAGWARAVVDVAVGPAEPVDRALAVAKDEIARFAEDDEWSPLLDGVPEVWGVETIGDNRVVIRAVARTQPGGQWGVARELRRRIKNRFDDAGVRLPGIPLAASPITPPPAEPAADPLASGPQR